MSSKPAAASHGRVEHARQQLVNAEEAYLRAHGWALYQYAGRWLWRRDASVRDATKPAEFVAMERSDAVLFQHTKLEG